MALSPVKQDVRPYAGDYYRARLACPGFRREVEHALRLLDLRPGDRLLEVGCGAGALLAAASQYCPEVVGLEVNRGALRMAERAGEVVCADAEHLPFADGAFDAMVAQHLIEHFAAPEPLLREWRRVLLPGGRLVLLTPNARYPDPALFFDPDHRLIFSRGHLRQVLREAGFRVARDYTLFPFLGSRRLGRVARRLLWLRRLPWFSERGATIFVRARRA
jgi:ubiquinone/menaquinone biosynthesis C-methylase UbiE